MEALLKSIERESEDVAKALEAPDGQMVEVVYKANRVKEEIEKRDYQDTHREVSPLKKADDAIVVDSSDLSIDEVVSEILDIINKKVME